MDWEKIKEFVIEKKVYAIIVLVVIVGGFWLKKENQNNSEVENMQMMQSSSMSSSSSTSNVSNTVQTSNSKTITCDISGAIKHQGVYTLKNGARLQELIEAAGGITSRAQVKVINRAVLLKDQDKIYIPYKGEKVESAVTTPNTNSGNNDSANSSNQAGGDKVNLNTANITELQKLTGIGEKKAEQIIAYREQNGSFQKIEDLMQVSGIGEKTFASLKDQLAI
ncbi:ComEA family DNA-binding protein [Lactobacillus acidophilus]|uniref:helix-hairpin-helix domain-containing protein n=1 Tax=Lactobacillus acidophilus TaxID=1579 RepID=UPI0021A813DB|nr:helix-hairpin-helix domain-containing protein [Lactobacillus acidophilus]MCT3601816.1 ComEA family DNA-binding protein [Lactobacillus acidophilus]MCT3623150.1 ComEA family DNA-binding protein [Lactobacillus acidophilus]